MSLNIEQKVSLIKRNLQEIINEEKMIEILKSGRNIRLYWGTATTGKPHLAYFVPITKIADFLHAGCEVTILLADLHAYLDSLKTPYELLEHRVEFYKQVIVAMLETINVPVENLRFVKGTDYQLTKEYTLDVYKLLTMATDHDCKKAGSDVVKQSENPCLSSFIYPGLQALDEQYLNVDAQFGGVDQRKIFVFAEKYLPKMGYEKRIHLMNPMVPGLSGGKMSASEQDSKIDILESSQSLKTKLKKSFCEAGNIETNGLLSFCKFVIFPIMYYHPKIKNFIVERKEEYGGNLVYDSYDNLELDFKESKLHPGDFKNALFTHIDILLSYVREKFAKNPELVNLESKAYPKENQVKIKKKSDLVDASYLNFVVGKIVSIEFVNDSEENRVFKVEVKDKILKTCVMIQSRTIEKIEEIMNQNVIVVTNVFPFKFGGIDVDSYIVTIIVGDKKKRKNEKLTKRILKAPENSIVGDIIYFDKFYNEKNSLELLKKNERFFETVQEDISIDSDGKPIYKGNKMMNKNGDIVSLLENLIIN